MYLTYFDDTGYTGTNYSDPQQPVQGLCSISVNETIWKRVEKDCHIVVGTYFPNEADKFFTLKGAEFHASAIFGGHGLFRSWPRQRRLSLLHDIVDVIVKNQLPLVGAFVEKRHAAQILQTIHVADDLSDFLFLAMYATLDEQLSRSKGPRRTVLAGDYDSVKPEQADALAHFLDPPGVAGARILESVRFMDSQHSFGVQLSDAAAYLLNRRISRPNEQNSAVAG